MPWYYVLIVSLASAGLASVIWFFILQRQKEKNQAPELEAQLKQIKSSLDLERERIANYAAEQIKETARKADTDRAAVQKWYAENKAKLDQSSRSEFENLAHNPSLVIDQLDDLLTEFRKDSEKTKPY